MFNYIFMGLIVLFVVILLVIAKVMDNEEMNDPEEESA